MLIYTSGSDSPEIRLTRLDGGVFTTLHRADAGPGSGYLAQRPGFLYGINRNPSRALAFAVEPTGALRAINQVVVPGAKGATHIVVHPRADLLMLAHFLSGHVSVHPIGPDGAVGEASDVQATPPEAHQVVPTSDGRFLFVPCRAGDAVCQFVVDAATGKLTPNDPFLVKSAPGAGPRHMALHPSGRFAFLLGELDGTFTTFRLDPVRGTLLEPSTVSNVPPGFGERAAAHVEVHASGRFVYASNRQHGSITVWSFDPDTGRTSLVGHETGGGRIKAPRDFTVAGDLLLSVNQDGDAILGFDIQDDGTLRLAATGQVQSGPTCVQLLATLPR